MVEVDVFWSYGLSSGLALAAGADLKNEKSFFLGCIPVWGFL